MATSLRWHPLIPYTKSYNYKQQRITISTRRSDFDGFAKKVASGEAWKDAWRSANDGFEQLERIDRQYSVSRRVSSVAESAKIKARELDREFQIKQKWCSFSMDFSRNLPGLRTLPDRESDVGRALPKYRKQLSDGLSTPLGRSFSTATYEIVQGSYVLVTRTKPETAKEEKTTPKVETVGAFQRLPMVKPSVDILYSALRKAKKISPTKGIVNIAKREKNRGAKQLDALMKELGIPLREYMENFPNKKYLHPYERSLIELTLGDGNYEEVLGRVNALKKKVVSVGKEHASLCAKSTTKREAEERLSEGMKKVEAIFKLEAKAVDDLLNIAKTLRAVPVVDLETPTLCLVGAPNVGKSSLVRILSTGKPEVCNYPFTTRGILMGHITVNFQRFQVTDTPGLLRRCDDDRNNLEKLTLAVLSHLPTAVLYVHDLTGECGTSPSNQYIIYKEVRERFSNHLWVDVVSKCDLLEKSPVHNITEDGDEDTLEMARYKKAGPEGAILVSVKTETGLDELKSRVHDMLMSQLDKLKSESTSPES